jgi:hypothetical protein
LSRFRVVGIWPLKPTTMHEKTNHSSLYVVDNTTTNNRQGEDGDFITNEDNEMDEKESNIQCEE